MKKESLERGAGYVLNFLGGAVLDKNPFLFVGGLALQAGGLTLTSLSEGKKIGKKHLLESLGVDVAAAAVGYGLKKFVESKFLGKAVKEEQ